MSGFPAAFKSRWDATGMDALCPGGLWYARVPEESQREPGVYASYASVNSSSVNRGGTYQFFETWFQFDFYTDSGELEDCEDAARAWLLRLHNSHGDTQDPFLVDGRSVISVEPTGDVLTDGDGVEQVFRSTFTMRVSYSQDVPNS